MYIVQAQSAKKDKAQCHLHHCFHESLFVLNSSKKLFVFAGRRKLHYEYGAWKQKRISEATELVHILVTGRQKCRINSRGKSSAQDVGSEIVDVSEDDRNLATHLDEARGSEISRKRLFQRTAFAGDVQDRQRRPMRRMKIVRRYQCVRSRENPNFLVVYSGKLCCRACSTNHAQ